MKKKYDTLLFDVDDTLLDFGAAETQALGKLFNDLGIELDDEIEASYKSYNQSLWKKLEVGSITRKQLLATRFPTFFKKYFSLDVDADVLTPKYMNYLSMGHEEVCGARQLLTSLKNSEHKLYVVSNGNLDVQNRRLRDRYSSQRRWASKNRIRNFLTSSNEALKDSFRKEQSSSVIL